MRVERVVTDYLLLKIGVLIFVVSKADCSVKAFVETSAEIRLDWLSGEGIRIFGIFSGSYFGF